MSIGSNIELDVSKVETQANVLTFVGYEDFGSLERASLSFFLPKSADKTPSKEYVSLGCGDAVDLDGNTKKFLLLGYDIMETILEGREYENVCGLIQANGVCYWVDQNGAITEIGDLDDRMTEFREMALMVFAKHNRPILRERRGIDPRRAKGWGIVG